MSKIFFWNREQQCEEEEKVMGQKSIEWLYQSPLGKMINPLITHPLISQIYGKYQSSKISKKNIAPFIKEFNISHDDFDLKYNFDSFNDFFIRPFKKSRRNFVQESILPAFAEGRYLGWESMNSQNKYPIKGIHITLAKLLESDILAEEFCDGPLMIARLCPVDYHRFHFPDSGRVDYSYTIGGLLDSVNPIALKNKDKIFLKNQRTVTVFESEYFGKLLLIDVGATCVGKIVQSYTSNTVQRGDEKGYFLFGGSTVIICGKKGAWIPSSDILENTQAQREVFVKLGDAIGKSL